MVAARAGLATVPLTLVMLALSSRAGALAARIGPRLPLSVGPVVCAAGTLLLRRVGEGTDYLTGVLPGMVLFALGLVLLVAPLTSSVLAAAPDRFAGIASGINNAIARTARCWRSPRCRPWSGSAGPTPAARGVHGRLLAGAAGVRRPARHRRPGRVRRTARGTAGPGRGVTPLAST